MISSGSATGERKFAASNGHACAQRPLCRRLRKVKMAWPPAIVHAMPEPLRRWVTKDPGKNNLNNHGLGETV
jgi:hypothetical protein